VNLIRKLILLHGYAFVFAYILAVQSGAPVPADPILLVMGAMVGEGRYSYPLAVLASMGGALMGDWVWYELGRYRGRSIVKLLCRWSLEPDTCVRQTEDTFGRHGPRTLLIAKFVPGMSLVSIPLAGMIKMPRLYFLMWDAYGAALWTATYLLIGVIFHKQVESVMNFLSQLGHWAIVVLLGALGLYFAFKYFQRWRFVHSLKVNRVSPEELMERLSAGIETTIVDLRHPLEIEREGFKIAGAMVVRPQELRARAREISKNQEVVLYCSCPNEITSVKVALELRKAGLHHVRPLEGGFDGWRALHYPIEAVIVQEPSREETKVS
jgi:membrane protein DedA with SNARE-associated domain/rhodanese-related sulfurtransferase